MGRYDEAEQIEKASQERYDTSYAWHRWCHTTGRGNLEGARKDADAKAREVEKPDGDPDSDAAVSLLLDGQRDRARALFERVYKKGRDPYEALQLALLQVEDGKLDVATETLEQANLASGAMPSQLAGILLPGKGSPVSGLMIGWSVPCPGPFAVPKKVCEKSPFRSSAVG
jgi:Flp pilus assembly protein TadD